MEHVIKASIMIHVDSNGGVDASELLHMQVISQLEYLVMHARLYACFAKQ